MTTANTQMVTRCPQCATAFRITSAQLQSAKGAVRCGSCLHVFKALEHVVGEINAQSGKSATPSKPEATKAPTSAAPITPAPPVKTTVKPQTPAKTITATPTTPKAAAASKTSAPVKVPAPATPTIKPSAKPPAEPDDDLLISDDMDKESSHKEGYEFDGYLDIDLTPKSTSTLFDREIREPKEYESKEIADESWAEELMDDDDDTPRFSAMKIKQEREPTDADIEAAAEAFHLKEQAADTASTSTQGLLFSLVGEVENKPTQPADDNDFIISDELANAPSHSGFNGGHKPSEDKNQLDPNLFESPEENAAANKRQVKTEPKIRAYDNSRTALLMNIIPAPVEFTAKRMRRWYQKKLWPTLCVLALITLVIQIGWLKFDYFSRVEPYRTGYTFLCPLIGCQVPTLVDARQVSVFNLVVRAHPDTENALLVDAILLNKAPFEQPFTDLVLAFTDLDEKPVASRRFTPKEYIGGEMAGKEFMPRNQPIHITLEIVDPGAQAVNYHAYIPR